MLGRDGQAAIGTRWNKTANKIAPLIGCLLLSLAGACGLDVLKGLTHGSDAGPPGGDGDVSPDAGDGDGDGGLVSPLCSDMKQNGGESAIDCGGKTHCPRCDTGKACSESSDCASSSCKAKKCAAPTCSDQVRNQGEEGVDCGGPCPTCDPCKNGKKDDGEIDIDCGGTCADTACVTGSSCTQPADCASGSCGSDKKCHAGVRGAYWPAAAWIGATQSASEVPWTALSHVLVAYVGISPELECAFWTDQNSADKADDAAKKAATDLINYRNMHAKGVRVLLSIGGPELSYRFSTLAREEEKRKKFVSSCVSLMAELDADGIDVDWRFPSQFAGPASGAGKCRDADGCQDASDPDNFTALLRNFRDEFAAVDMAGSLLTAVLRANSKNDLNNVPYDYKSLFAGKPRLLDWVSLASYELHGPSETKVDFGAPFPDVIDAMSFARDQVGANNASSLSLGVSFTGPQWSAVAAPDASGIGNTGTGAGFISYRTAQNYVSSHSAQCGVRIPTTGNTRNHYVYCTGNVGGMSNLWISYDDEIVLRNKAKFTTINRYAGVTAWLLGQDTADNDLFNAMQAGMDEQNPFGDAPLSLPALVQAEDYDTGGEGKAYHDTTPKNSLGNYRTDDVDIEMCMDRGAGFDLGAMASGEWLEYTVSPQAAGKHNLEFRVASEADSTKLHIEKGNTFITPTVSIPNTGGAQVWTTIELNTPTLTTGEQQLRLVADYGPFSINWFRFTRGQSPYLGAPVSIPGTIEAEFFDIGGADVAYHDTSTTQNTLERTGPVSIEADFDGTNSMHVLGIQSGEWLEYTVDVEQAGEHNVELRAATAAPETLHLEDGSGNVLTDAPITTPATGETYDYLSIEARHPITLPSGVQVLRVAFDTVGSATFNFNWLRVTRGQVPYLGAPAEIPGTIQAEAFDLGGADVAYHDSTLGNAYTKYRYTDVDVQPCADDGSGFDITQIEAGDWTEYTVNVLEEHAYDIEVRASRGANTADPATMHFELDGTPVGGAVSVTYTGGSQVWQSFVLKNVSLSAGQHVLRAAYETKYASYNYFKFTRSN